MAQLIKTEENYTFLDLFNDLRKYTQGYNRRLLLWYFIRSFTALQILASPFILASIVDCLTKENIFSSKLITLVIIFTINNLVQIILRVNCSFYVHALASKIRLNIRQKALSKFLSFDLDWHEQENSGKKITVISHGADSARSLVKFFGDGSGGLDIIFGILGVLGYFMLFQPKYFILAFLNVVLYLGINQWQNSMLLKKWHKLNIVDEKVVSKNFDYFSNIGLIKRLGIGQNINRSLFEKELELTNESIATSRLSSYKWISIDTISHLTQSVAVILIIVDIINGRISVGTFFIITGYFANLRGYLGNIASQFDGVIDNKLGFLRLVQLTSSGQTNTDIGRRLSPLNPSINFRNVSFHYPRHKSYILKNLNLSIPSGQKVGLVGESGSGKSTFTKLLLRLYLLNQGNIFFNKTNINNIKTEDLRQQFAIVPQESEVFNLTFTENIIIASDKDKFDKILYKKSVEIAECQTILTKIKNNHQTVLGEKGVKLSGGERQRLGIARAIYKNSPIMIFDESTSSLDSKTEEKILNNIEKSLQDKTIIWIAHRLSTLRFTDRIIVFENGIVAEDGSFNKLVDKKGLFYQLWQIQQRSQLKS